jgi:hypothetical protein
MLPCVALLGVTTAVVGQQSLRLEPEVAPPSGAVLATDVGGAGEEPISSVEQGQTPLSEIFEHDRRQWRLEKRRDALRDTQFKVNFRSYYFDRDKFDGSKSESLAIGGSVGFKTGYFLDHIAFAATGYTSQHLYGDDENDGALLLKSGQEGYTVLGEAYADIRIIDDLNLYVGRKEFDTPFINRNDTRMTPNSFEAIVLQGKAKLGDDATLKYGLGYFSAIKDRNSDEFVSMSSDAGAETDHGVFTGGALYQKGGFSIGAIDYYCPDVINIGYAEAKIAFPITDDLKPRLAVQFTDQRSVGDELLQDDSFSVRQYGVKAELPVGRALFTAAYTHNTDGGTIQSPWSLYPGYTAVQVEEFLRAGEAALLLRAGYDFTWIEGLSAYTLWVHGMDPDDAGQFARDEVDFNLQWAPPKGILNGLSFRVRYAIVEEHGGDSDYLNDFRVICNYGLNF